VTGTGTAFTSIIKPGDWIRVKGQTDYFEIMAVLTDTTLTLRTPSTYTDSGISDMRQPEYYVEGESVLNCDVIGKSDDGLKTGNLLYRCGEIVKDILVSVGIPLTDLNTSTFSTANDLAYSRLGVSIPETFDDTQTPKSRDIINQVNESVFGALVQNEDFLLEYQVLSPSRTTADIVLDETDVLSFSVSSDSGRIVKDTIVEYGGKEYDALTGGPSVLQYVATSDPAQYLAKSEKTVTKKTKLVDLTPAQIVAQRFSFIREVSSSVVKLTTKLQASRLQVTDVINFQHPKLYERLGSNSNTKLASISSLDKSSSDVSIEMDDLGNSFTRCGTITPNAAPTYSASTDEERAAYGFITENDGLQGTDYTTAGIHLIF
jgi:hypothetical protein